MKKYLCLLLAAIMLLSCLPAAAEAAEFPKLDPIAAKNFWGDWFSVSGLDVMGDPTTDYPSLELSLYAGGLGDAKIDGEKAVVVGWYIGDDCVYLAHTVDRVPDPEQIFAYAYKNETGRLVVDFGYAAAICEQEGEEYLDAVWPEFDAEDAKYFIGAWEAVDDGTGTAEAVGIKMLVLKDDGTALSIEEGEEPYELKWYSDYSVAYVGENASEVVEISFDGTGNICLKFSEELTLTMAPAVYEEAEPVVETGTILGTWEDSSKTVEITEDGKLKMTYKSDGYINNMQWGMVEDVPTVTLGTWKNAAIVFADGKLTIETNGLYYEFTRVGEVPEIYVGPGGFAGVSDDAAPFIGDWNEEGGRGVLTFKEDYTAVMNFTDGRVYDFNWKTTEDGAIFTSGMWFDTAMVIEEENTLNIGEGWMILERVGAETQAGTDAVEGTDTPAESATVQIDYVSSVADDFIGGWISVDDPTLQMLLLEGEANLIEGTDCYTVTWAVVDGVAEFDGMKFYIQEDWSTGILDMGEVQAKFERGYVEKPKASTTSTTTSDTTATASGDGVLSDEELKAYVGTWHMVYMETGGLVGDMRERGLTGKLELNADGTGKLSGIADDSGKWYDDEGTVRFGQGDSPLVLLDGGFLRYGNQLAGYMVFSQDETATWTPTSAAAPVAPVATAAPTAAPSKGLGLRKTGSADSAAAQGNEFYQDKTFKLASAYTLVNDMQFPVDIAAYGEYTVFFGSDGSIKFVMSGFEVPNSILTWSIREDGAFVINYSNAMNYVFVPDGEGFKMDNFGVTMCFVQAE